MKKNKHILVFSLLCFCFLFFSNIFSAGVLKRVTNIFQGPVVNALKSHKKIKKGIKEPFYWLATNSSNSLDAAACHEAAHTLVACKLGFRVIATSVYKDNILRYAYVGKTEFELKEDGNSEKTEQLDSKSLKDLNDEILKNLICLSLAGGLGTEIVYGQDYGMSGDDKIFNLVGTELIKRYNNSLLDYVLYYTKNLSFISKADFDDKIKDLKKECYVRTKELLIENRETLDELSERLKSSQEKVLYEVQIREIIEGEEKKAEN